MLFLPGNIQSKILIFERLQGEFLIKSENMIHVGGKFETNRQILTGALKSDIFCPPYF